MNPYIYIYIHKSWNCEHTFGQYAGAHKNRGNENITFWTPSIFIQNLHERLCLHARGPGNLGYI